MTCGMQHLYWACAWRDSHFQIDGIAKMNASWLIRTCMMSLGCRSAGPDEWAMFSSNCRCLLICISLACAVRTHWAYDYQVWGMHICLQALGRAGSIWSWASAIEFINLYSPAGWSRQNRSLLYWSQRSCCLLSNGLYCTGHHLKLEIPPMLKYINPSSTQQNQQKHNLKAMCTQESLRTGLDSFHRYDRHIVVLVYIPDWDVYASIYIAHYQVLVCIPVLGCIY